jgi:hypothetical protein
MLKSTTTNKIYIKNTVNLLFVKSFTNFFDKRLKIVAIEIRGKTD